MAIETSGLTDLEAETPLTAFVGNVDGKKVPGYSYQKFIDTVGSRRFSSCMSLFNSLRYVFADTWFVSVMP